MARRASITKEIVERVLKDAKSYNLTRTEIGTKNGISYSSVCRILKGDYDYLLEETKPKEEVRTSRPSEDEVIKSAECTELKKKPIINVGLISNRHPMNEKENIDYYVFQDRLSEDLMFDFKRLLYTCKDFLYDHIKFNENNLPEKGVVLYTTGATTALIAFINACYSLKIPLQVAHYDNLNGIYRKQLVYTRYNHRDDGYYYTMDNILNEYNKVYAYKCTIEKLMSLNSIYVVVLNDKAIIAQDIKLAYSLCSKFIGIKGNTIQLVKYINHSGIFTFATRLNTY